MAADRTGDEIGSPSIRRRSDCLHQFGIALARPKVRATQPPENGSADRYRLGVPRRLLSHA